MQNGYQSGYTMIFPELRFTIYNFYAMRKYFGFLFIIPLICSMAFAQSDISTKLLFEENSDISFTSEWQYLSTDIYLFNTNKFERLINDLDNDQRKVFKKKNELEFLTITAKLKNLKYFGNSEIVYPIYNYKVGNNAVASNDSRSSSSQEVIRLIDNLPVSSVDDVVEAKIEGRAVTKNKKNELLNIISNQLINISNFKNPTEAAFYLVGEMGQYMKSLISSTDYQFSSTIRLYEGDNFSKKLHSVKVYALLPPGRDAFIRTTNLNRLVKSTNPDVNRKSLDELIRYHDYPLIVVVNYKSKYEMPVIVGEEVTPELIAQRKVQVEKDYDNGLINDAIYRQEKAFTEYLEKFAELNKNLQSYSLALQMGNQLYISQTLFDIITNYREMLTIRQSRDIEFAEMSAYENVFKPEYESVMRNADVYMEKDRNLKSCHIIAENLFLMNNNDSSFSDPQMREAFLSAFYSVELPESKYLQASVMGREILAQITMLENRHYRDVFLPKVNQLMANKSSDLSQQYRNSLLREVNKTSCEMCKTKVLSGIRSYDERYRDYLIDRAVTKKDSVVKFAETAIFDLYQKEECLNNNLEMYEDNPPVWYNLVTEKHKQLLGQLGLLEVVLSVSNELNTNNEKDVVDYTSHLRHLVAELNSGYTALCNRIDGLCDCQEIEEEK